MQTNASYNRNSTFVPPPGSKTHGASPQNGVCNPVLPYSPSTRCTPPLTHSTFHNTGPPPRRQLPRAPPRPQSPNLSLRHLRKLQHQPNQYAPLSPRHPPRHQPPQQSNLPFHNHHINNNSDIRPSTLPQQPPRPAPRAASHPSVRNPRQSK